MGDAEVDPLQVAPSLDAASSDAPSLETPSQETPSLAEEPQATESTTEAPADAAMSAEDLPTPALAAGAAFLLMFLALHRPVSRFLSRTLLRGAPQAPGVAAEPQLGEHAGASRFHLRGIDFVAVLFLYATSILLIPATVFYVLRDSGTSEEPDPAFFEGLSIEVSLALNAALMLLPALYLACLPITRRGAARALGWRGAAPGFPGAYAVGRYVTMFPVILGLGLVTMLIYRGLDMAPPQQDVAVRIQEGLSDPLSGSAFWIVLLAAVVVPLLEEILFRGFLLEFLRERSGSIVAIILSSAIFALLHGPAAALPIFGLACLLASIKLRTGSLYAAWLVHGVHNGLQTILLTNGIEP